MVAVQNYHGNPAPPGKPVLTFQTGDVIELLRGDPESQWWEVGPGVDVPQAGVVWGGGGSTCQQDLSSLEAGILGIPTLCSSGCLLSWEELSCRGASCTPTPWLCCSHAVHTLLPTLPPFGPALL